MSIRSKLLVIFLLVGIAPMLLVSVANYVSSARAIERLLRDNVKQEALRIARHTEEKIRVCEADLIEMSQLALLRTFMREPDAGAADAVDDGEAPPAPTTGQVAPAADVSTVAAPASTSVKDEVRQTFTAYLVGHQHAVAAVTCLSAPGKPLFRIVGKMQPDNKVEVRFQTEDFVASDVRADDRVWTIGQAAAVVTPLRSPITFEPTGALLRSTIPVFLDGMGTRGALVVELKVDSIIKQSEASEKVSDSPGASGGRAASHLVVALDRSQKIIYHTNEGLKFQTVAATMPFFKPIAEQMMTTVKADTDAYEDKAADGDRWLAGFQPVGNMQMAVAVAANYSQAVGGLQRAGLSGVALALLAALLATTLLVVLVGRMTRRIERVVEGAAAIAGGNLNQRIEVETNDETHVLAESFNRMTDRLREQIQREAETRQFQSFMRLSAMLTHDLKNSIQALSMLVSNMEKQFHREEFRADAILSLREATEKLRRLVARLSEPVKSLSGEYRRDARLADLVPVINRVLDTTARASPLYTIDAPLPDKLEAFIEPERIENVIENLVINAMEAMGTSGGHLTVAAGTETDERVFFSVADTGSGMTQEFIKNRLFKPFSTTKSKGIGLGLFTCREIVETHGGRLEVESRVGIGTRFRVVLPSKPLTLRERLEQSQSNSVTRSGASRA